MKRIYFLLLGISLFMVTSCSDFLDIKPLNKVAPEQVFSDISGVKAVLATLYNKMPVEDFTYNPTYGFNYHHESNNWTALGYGTTFFTDDATLSHGSGVTISHQYWGYDAIRQINQFIAMLPSIKMDKTMFDQLTAEAHFIRAYTYFALAKRYGGVPIITEAQQIDDDSLNIPRSTEKETWNFVMSECDKAISALPASYTDAQGPKRATKWAAYALKSRAALFAASVAKYWNKAPLVGDAVDAKLVGGMTTADADNYYSLAADAAKQIIDNSGKNLYKPNPSSVDEAITSYKKIFEDPTNSEVQKEVIFSKGYIDGSQTAMQGHNTDVFFNPAQTNCGYWAYGRYSPALDLVDVYEDYSDNGIGASKKLITREDGKEDDYVANPGEGIDLNVKYVEYNNMSDIFKGKDARLYASIILPGTIWKSTKIIMQGGLIAPNGTQMIYKNGQTEKNGTTYYTYGGANAVSYSGFANLGTFDDANYTITGFSLKKFLQEGKTVAGVLHSSTTEFIDFRLAEMYLNYAEAVVESGKGDASLAKTYLNALRKRAGHKDEIALTLNNVLKERRVELAFEGQRYWDLVRRREAHEVFNGSTCRKALVPILDLRGDQPKYIFVRANSYFDNKSNGQKFNEKSYYVAIPGIATNHLIQNPQY